MRKLGSGVKYLIFTVVALFGTLVLLFLLVGGFFYFSTCPTGNDRVGLPISEWVVSPIPYLRPEPPGCLTDNSVRVFLGEVGIMDDATPRVPRLPG